MLTRLRLAETDEFRALTRRLENAVVYEAPLDKGDHPVVTVYRQYDPEHDGAKDGYYYFERAGRDSVAFLLYDDDRADPYGCCRQWHGPLRRFNLGAFTGSIDKDLDPLGIVGEEAEEEAGYDPVALDEQDRIHELDQVSVSGNSNETVHLYLIDVTDLEAQKKAPENIFEAQIETVWLSREDVYRRCEWKARLIALAYEPQSSEPK